MNDTLLPQKIENTSKILKILADINRIKILFILSTEKICVCNLAKKMGIAQNLVSHHLKVLESAGILEKNRKGNEIYYSIIPSKMRIIRNLKILSDIN